MNSPAIVLVLLGTLTVTSYRSVKNQTDTSPFITSTGERVNPHGVAVSQDLLCPLAHGNTRLHNRKTCPFKDKIHYGDWVLVEGYGLKVVNDCMNERMTNHFDMWVSSHKEEKEVGTRKLNIWALQL